MSKEKKNSRSVWSYSLCRLPEEDESAQLETALREQSLTFWEDASALRRFISLRNLSQSACASLLGRSQASVANRLRILNLPESIRKTMQAHALTERHARAILRLGDEKAQRAVLEAVIRQGMNVAQTEAYVEEYLSHHTAVTGKETEIFAPLLSELERVRRTVPSVKFALRETETEIHLLISFPKNDGY